MEDPPTTCSKCGLAPSRDDEGQPVFSGPSYVGPEDVMEASGREWSIPERLRWRCRRCGYIFETDTLDATP